MGRNSVLLQRSSASRRYWKAKLQVLKRPAVWGSILALGLPLLFLSQYWRNPGEFVGFGQDPGQDPGQSDFLLPGLNDPGAPAANLAPNPAANSTTGPAISDASTYLDIPALTATGDLEALDGILQPGLLEALLAAPLPEAESRGQSQLTLSNNPARNSASASRANQPARAPSLTSAVQQAPGFFFSSDPQLNSANSAASSNGGRAGQEQGMVLNPLQAALDRNAGITSAAANGSSMLAQAVFNSVANATGAQPGTQNGALTGQSLAQSSGSYSVPYSGQAFNSGRGAVNGQFSGGTVGGTVGDPALRWLGQSYLPRTSPYPGTTGYTLPTALRPAVSAYPNFAYPSGSYPTGLTLSPYAMQPLPGVPALPQLLPGAQLPQMPASLYGSSTGYGIPGYGVPSGSTGQVYPNFGTAPSPIIPVPPAPFSVPRTPPGRSIGNGEINTFSNP